MAIMARSLFLFFTFYCMHVVCYYSMSCSFCGQLLKVVFAAQVTFRISCVIFVNRLNPHDLICISAPFPCNRVYQSFCHVIHSDRTYSIFCLSNKIILHREYLMSAVGVLILHFASEPNLASLTYSQKVHVCLCANNLRIFC